MLILSKKISISSEQLDELQERHDLVLKVPQKNKASLSLSLSLENTNLEKVTTTVKL